MQEELTPFERDAMTALVAGGHPVLEGLREQLAVCEVTKRDFTGVGLFTSLALSAEVQPVSLSRRIVLGDAHATMDGVAHGVGLLLYVERGLLHLLEAFTYDEPWPDQIENYSITPGGVMHFGGSETDLAQIDAAWVRPSST